MLTDLSVVAIIGAVALAVVSLTMMWLGRCWAGGVLPWGGKAALRTRSMRSDARAQVVGNRAAGPYLERYGRIITTLAVLVAVVSLVNDVTAIVLYIVALCFAGLGGFVVVRQAEAGVRNPRQLRQRASDQP